MVEMLLRAKKLDVTLTSARPWSRDEREARLAPTGWPSVDAALGGGFPRGECSEIAGPASSGRTSVLCALMAAAAARGEVMALVDTLDCFDPVSAAAMGMDLSRLLWVRGTAIPVPLARHRREVRGAGARLASAWFRGRGTAAWADEVVVSRCVASRRPFGEWGRQAPQDERGPLLGGGGQWGDGEVLERVLDRAIKSFGLVLQSGGFGVVALDLADVPMRAVKRLPFTTWLRAQRLIEGRDTVGIVIAREPIARSARGVTVRLDRRRVVGAHLEWRRRPQPSVHRLHPASAGRFRASHRP